jgi:hypothetical protein
MKIVDARGIGTDRAMRMARVKFIALPIEDPRPAARPSPPSASALLRFLLRAIGRPGAARP